VDDVLAGLDVFGGVAPALKAMAQSLADLMDSREDLRPGASKELRAVLADLSPSREVADDAASFLAGLSSPLRNAPA
jgi:predicted component of type VI protein secretion system